MTANDGPITTEPRLRIEELLVALLQADPALADLPIVAGSNRDAQVPPLHCFVLCREAAPVMNVGQNYRADVVVVVASNIDDNVHAERKAFAKAVLKCLTRQDPTRVPPFHDAAILGWAVKRILEVSDGQNTGDRIELMVAAHVAAES
jgi:hypothetical protein